MTDHTNGNDPVVEEADKHIKLTVRSLDEIHQAIVGLQTKYGSYGDVNVIEGYKRLKLDGTPIYISVGVFQSP